MAEGLDAFTFGLQEPADCTAADLIWDKGLPTFDIVIHGERYAHVSLRVGGTHNVSNALAARGGLRLCRMTPHRGSRAEEGPYSPLTNASPTV